MREDVIDVQPFCSIDRRECCATWDELLTWGVAGVTAAVRQVASRHCAGRNSRLRRVSLHPKTPQLIVWQTVGRLTSGWPSNLSKKRLIAMQSLPTLSV